MSEIQIIRKGYSKYEGSDWVLVPENELNKLRAENKRLKEGLEAAERVIDAARVVDEPGPVDTLSVESETSLDALNIMMNRHDAMDKEQEG